MIAAPEGANDTHLEALAQLSKFLLQAGFTDKVKEAKYPRQVLELFSEDTEEIEQVTDSEHYVLAVTACTTGIAHTYMAEEALKNKLLKWASPSKLKQMGRVGLTTS